MNARLSPDPSLSSIVPTAARRTGRFSSPIRRSLNWFTWSTMLRGMFEVLCGGSTILFVAFALAAGIPGEKVGRFTIAASLGCVFQILCLPLLARVSNQKRFVVTAGMVEPIVLVAGVLASVLLPRELRLYALMGSVFVAAAFFHAMRPVMDDWVASTVPEGLRGRFLGRRAQLWSFGLLLAMLGAGWAGQWAHGRLWALACLLTLGAGFGVAAILAISRATMLRAGAVRSVTPDDLRRVFRESAFRRYLLGAAIYSLPFLLAVPYYQVYQQTILRMPLSRIALVLVLYHLVRMALSVRMGRWVDRVGARRMVLLSGPIFATFFLMMATGSPERLWPVYIAWPLVGIADAMYPVAISAALFGAVPPTGARPAFFAVSNMLGLGLFALGPMIGEPLLKALASVHLALGPLTFDQYQIVYALCGLVMLPATLGSLLLIDRKSTRQKGAGPSPANPASSAAPARIPR